VKIAQIDPSDANTVYLRVSANGADSIWITTDGGAHAQPLLSTASTLGGFVRASDGALYAGTSAGDFYVRAPGANAFDRVYVISYHNGKAMLGASRYGNR